MIHLITSNRLRPAMAAACFLLLLAGFNQPKAASAQAVYPFELAEKMDTKLVVRTDVSTPINRMLWGINCSWPERQYAKLGYNHPDAQKLITSFQPSSLRFPHGVWANFYDWESDGRRMTDNYKTLYDSAVKDHPELKYGFDGLHKLHQKQGFDVLFTFNVNYDSAEKAVRRLMDLQEKGFAVPRVELGNEIFWKTQRSEAVSTVEKYIAVSKAHAERLKKHQPDLRVSVPIHWRKILTDPWNAAMCKEDYYDAITIHKYVHAKESKEGAISAFRARSTILEMANTLGTLFPGKPIWLSEWGVSCGENAISVLSMADVYLGLMEHPEIFEVASYFQLNSGDAIIRYDQKTGTHTRTSVGAAFQVMHDVFLDGELCLSELTSPNLCDGVDAVSAKAVVKNGKVTVLAINKTLQSIPMTIVIDGRTPASTQSHQALAFDDIDSLKEFAMDEPFTTNVSHHAGDIILPPLSINQIELHNAKSLAEMQ